MTKISATIVADSKNQQGDRITTMLLTYPRIIHAEMMTHRMLSKNSASSRAIPFKKMVESVQNDPFIPIAWQKEHKGMQGTEYFTDKEDIQRLEDLWVLQSKEAIKSAQSLNNLQTTKQLCNRLLEPFMWHTVLITGTEFSNFFELRCPQYTVSWYPSNKSEALEPSQASFKSRKDAIKYTEGECNNWKEQDWKDSNEGQAEIDMMALAEAMWDAMNESTPKELKENEWHLPMIEVIED